jgi:CBS domain-containing membrane protein
MGLEFAVMSYAGRLSISAVADGALVPDAQAIADAVAEEASALTAACRPEDEARRDVSDHAPCVADLMSRGVAILRPGDSLLFAHRTMSRLGIRHLPVLDDDDRMVGIVSHRDILGAQTSSLAAVAPEARVRCLARREADEVMETHVTVAFEDERAADAAVRMMRQRIGCLPVLSRSGKLVGIVTAEDYLRWATARMAASPSAATTAPAQARDMSFWASQGSPCVPRNAVPA